MRNRKEKSDKEKDIQKDIKNNKEPVIEEKQEEDVIDKTDEASKTAEADKANETDALQEKKIEFYLTKATRIALYAIGAAVAIGSIAALFIKMKPYEKTEDVKINSYTITTDASYKVHLTENNVFEEEFLEEGRLYPNVVTDSVAIDFKSEISFIKDVSLSGDYNIKAVLEGYGDGGTDEKVTIYEKTYPLLEGKIDEQYTHNAAINESLTIERPVYKDYAQAIESVIGGETAKNFYILFGGKYNIDGGEEKEFSYKVYIPIGNEKFYKIKKDDTAVDSGDITEKTTLKVSPKFGSYSIYIVLLIAAVGIVVFIRFFTKDMEGERLKLKRLSQLMRKYGSRMISVDNIPDNAKKNKINVKSIIDLISISDEIREPVIYSEDADGMPENGMFYVLSKEYVYIYSKAACADSQPSHKE